MGDYMEMINCAQNAMHLPLRTEVCVEQLLCHYRTYEVVSKKLPQLLHPQYLPSKKEQLPMYTV